MEAAPGRRRAPASEDELQARGGWLAAAAAAGVHGRGRARLRQPRLWLWGWAGWRRRVQRPPYLLPRSFSQPSPPSPCPPQALIRSDPAFRQQAMLHLRRLLDACGAA